MSIPADSSSEGIRQKGERKNKNQEERPDPVASMIDGTGVFYAKGAGHAVTFAQKKVNVKLKDLTLRCLRSATFDLSNFISHYQRFG
jgi:hypothetical protein